MNAVELILSAGGDDATPPWWGIPLIAGGFVIAGSVLGFFFTRANETRKAKRENDRYWGLQVLERGERYLWALDDAYIANYNFQEQVNKLKRGQLKRNTHEPEYAAAETALENAVKAMNRARVSLGIITREESVPGILDTYEDYLKIRAKSEIVDPLPSPAIEPESAGRLSEQLRIIADIPWKKRSS